MFWAYCSILTLICQEQATIWGVFWVVLVGVLGGVDKCCGMLLTQDIDFAIIKANEKKVVGKWKMVMEIGKWKVEKMPSTF